MDLLETFERLGIALAIGILIGTERGWSERLGAAGSRVAGIRTFAISGLLGGLSMLLAERIGMTLLGFAFAAYALVITIARVRAASETGDYGATTIVAAMITFALGALTVAGEIAVAAASAVVTSLLLGAKAPLHELLKRIDYDELLAVLKLLAMTLVLLPVLPDRGYGPWQAFNPYDIWLMVILIAAISFLGYVAVRIGGARLGLPLAGLLGGLASSTAVALSFSRLGRQAPERAPLCGLAVAAASVTMFPRILAVAGVINPAVALDLAWPLGAATAAGYAATAVLWRRGQRMQPADVPKLTNPFEFLPALQFGLLLALVLLLSHALNAWLGDAGILAVAAVAGLADVDALNLTVSKMAPETVTVDLAATAILLAALVNSLAKAVIAVAIGGTGVARPVLVVLAVALAAGAVARWLI